MSPELQCCTSKLILDSLIASSPIDSELLLSRMPEAQDLRQVIPARPRQSAETVMLQKAAEQCLVVFSASRAGWEQTPQYQKKL